MNQTKLFCLIGNPVEHSFSPQMHNAAFKKFKLNFLYFSLKVEENHLFDVINGIKALNIRGGNITLPYKTSIIQFLDECDKTVKEVDSVNTFVNKNGKLTGFNTDGVAALKALEGSRVKVQNKQIIIIGAGGAAKSISYFIANKKPSKLTILNRTINNAKLITNKINEKFGIIAEAFELNSENLKSKLKDTDVLINCSSVGMYPNVNETSVPKEYLHENLTVMDIVYNPLETRLIKEAKMADTKTINGIDMFVNQGALSFEIWTGKKAPIKLMRKVVLQNLKR